MAGWQQFIAVGNVGRDPNMRYTQSGVPVCDFSLAVTRRFGGRDGGEKQEKTTWVKVTCWRQQAEIANQYVRKGMQLMVVGTVEVSAYTDKSGQPAASLELTVDNFQMLGNRAEREGMSGGSSGGDYDYQAPPDNVGEIPF
jgi:single-strand DNA-binding protein